MIPFRFTGTRGALFGAYHVASASESGLGVLLCNPFGQEAIRSHRMFRVLAARLARGGSPSFRFDYFGTGDSDGEDEEVSIGQWTEDLLAADEELRRRSGCLKVSWAGLRLGATVAAITSSVAHRPPDSLLLWDPIVNGSAWLDELAESHDRALAEAYGGSLAASRRVANTPGLAAESVGFPITEQLKAEIAALNPTLFDMVRCRRLVVLAGERNVALARLKEELSHRFDSLSWRQVSQSDWNSDEAGNTSIVPVDVVSAVVDELGGSR